MDKELNQLIEKVRDYQMTDDEIAEQRVSFAYGNTLQEEKDGFTKDKVRKVVTKGKRTQK